MRCEAICNPCARGPDGAVCRIQEYAEVRAATAFAIDAGRHERRRHQRVKVRLTGQFMRQDRHEFPCATIDISPGGIAFESEVSGEIGERIIAYLNQIGRVEGTVARHFYGGFAIQMKLPPLKREKLADQLTWLANRQVLGMPEDRRHERIEPRNKGTTLTLPGGRQHLGAHHRHFAFRRRRSRSTRPRRSAPRHRRLAAGAGGAGCSPAASRSSSPAYPRGNVRREHSPVTGRCAPGRDAASLKLSAFLYDGKPMSL